MAAEKPATVIIRFKKTDPFWSAFTNRIEPKNIRTEADDLVTAFLAVKHYDLQDHQFVRVKVNFNKRDAIVQLPRDLVHVIVEGKALDEAALGFVRGT